MPCGVRHQQSGYTLTVRFRGRAYFKGERVKLEIEIKDYEALSNKIFMAFLKSNLNVEQSIENTDIVMKALGVKEK
jgi:hypothetical protein